LKTIALTDGKTTIEVPAKEFRRVVDDYAKYHGMHSWAVRNGIMDGYAALALGGCADDMGLEALAKQLYRAFATMRGTITVGDTPRPPEPDTETELQELLEGMKAL
jgi:hypothetical protein